MTLIILQQWKVLLIESYQHIADRFHKFCLQPSNLYTANFQTFSVAS